MPCQPPGLFTLTAPHTTSQWFLVLLVFCGALVLYFPLLFLAYRGLGVNATGTRKRLLTALLVYGILYLLLDICLIALYQLWNDALAQWAAANGQTCLRFENSAYQQALAQYQGATPFLGVSLLVGIPLFSFGPLAVIFVHDRLQQWSQRGALE